jgi:outer membrane biosynthesis protein TonB
MRSIFKFFFATTLALLLNVSLVTAQGPPHPQLAKGPEVVYPAEGIDASFGGSVRVFVKIDKEGKVTVIRAYGPMAPCSAPDDARIAALRQAAVDAVTKAVFEPTRKNGEPVETEAVMTMEVPRPKPPESEKGIPHFVSGGVLNGRATSLPIQKYPKAAKEAHVGGKVEIQVLVDEQGKVVGAGAFSGDPLLIDESRIAACKAKFSGLTVQGHAVKLSGTLVYNFVP